MDWKDVLLGSMAGFVLGAAFLAALFYWIGEYRGPR